MNTKLLKLSQEQGMISTSEFLKYAAGLVDSIPIVYKTSYADGDNKKKQATHYYNIPAAFDIETTSFRDESGEKAACMYIWQFGLLNKVTYGRTWVEFTKFISALSAIMDTQSVRLVVYVHNLAYEFQFIRRLFSWTKLFFLDPRKPVYAITEDGIEFRCSLKLSSKSLAKVGEDLQKYHVAKKTGDLDYKLLRNSKTELSETELGYCENDIRVVIAYIQEKLESDGSITKIPLTNTGYVRNHCRDKCFERYKPYRALMKALQISGADEYKQLKAGFAGGFVHANARYVARMIEGNVIENADSEDFTSSYTSTMLLEMFPMSRGRLINLDNIKNPMQVFRQCLRKYCCLIDITLYNVREKKGMEFEHPLSVNKCKNMTEWGEDNGRIVWATKLSTTLTELDFATVTEFYDVDSFTVNRLRVYEKAYLPKPFVLAMLQLYKNKTVLKGVEGEEVNYMISKNMLNSSYGMCVTDIVRDIIDFDNDAINPNDTFKSTKPDIDEEIDRYNKSGRRFLFYPWGVWVTAYARRNLFSAIKECKQDYVYSDTDSVKILHMERHKKYFDDYNANILKKIEKAAKFHNIPPSEFSPLTKEGKVKTIGVWDYDGHYDYFKSLGAKRYLVRNKKGYKLTVAGLNKVDAIRYMEVQSTKPEPDTKSVFDQFNFGLTIPAEYSGRLSHTFFDEPCEGELTDYQGNTAHYREESYIHLEPSEYQLTVSDAYDDFLAMLLQEDEF